MLSFVVFSFSLYLFLFRFSYFHKNKWDHLLLYSRLHYLDINLVTIVCSMWDAYWSKLLQPPHNMRQWILVESERECNMFWSIDFVKFNEKKKLDPRVIHFNAHNNKRLLCCFTGTGLQKLLIVGCECIYNFCFN